MGEIKFTLFGRPITKKNSQRIIMVGGSPRIIQSKQFVHYEKDCLKQIPGKYKVKHDKPCNLCVRYYMPTKHRVDLLNLLEATCDILVKAGVLKDDESKIVTGHDGSRVFHDKERPRAEVEIIW